MKRILSVCLLLALCLSLCACDLTLDVRDRSEEGSADFWEKPESQAVSNNQSVQQEYQPQQTQPQQQYVQQPNTYVPAVTKPEQDVYASAPMIPAVPNTDIYYDGGYSNLEYWITYCDTLYMDETYLYGMTEAECRIARNAIYAKSGRIFTSSDLTNYFSYYAWYNPRVQPKNFTNSMMNAVQLHNLNVVITYEKRFG